MRNRRRNITIVYNEIDYDKLAEAIVKAQNNVKAPKKNSSKLRSAAMSFLTARFIQLYMSLPDYPYMLFGLNLIQSKALRLLDA